MTAAPHDFTLLRYEALVAELLRLGYTIRSFSDAEPAKPHLILRHDIDMSLDAAQEISEVEARLGVRSIYFVLARSEFYNLFTPASTAALEKLRRYGHDIGLHFDAEPYASDRPALEDAVATECEILERIIGAPVNVISFHRPTPALLDIDGAIAGRLHAYEPRFFRGMGYCSDSRGGWHHGHPLEHAAVQAKKALQLLTHPIWWTARSGESPQARLDRFASDRDHVIKQELARNCAVYSYKSRQ